MSERRKDPIEFKTRAEWCDEIRSLCSRLNAAGYEPQWTGKSLREYANTKFGVLLGLDGLGFAELLTLRDDLRRKLGARESERRAARSRSTPTARHALGRDADSSDEAA